MREGISIGGNVSIQISGPCAPADGSVTAAKINSGNAGDGQVLTADGSGGAAWEAAAGGGPGYLEYVALLSQSGTNAPVATVLKNTLGGTVVWTREAAGLYSATLAGAFPPVKTWTAVNAQADDGSSGWTSSLFSDTIGDAVVLFTGNDGSYRIYVEIRVYP